MLYMSMGYVISPFSEILQMAQLADVCFFFSSWYGYIDDMSL